MSSIGMTTIELDEHDLKMLLRAMNIYGSKLAKNERRNERLGWVPEEGKGNRVSLMQQRHSELTARLQAARKNPQSED